MWFPADTTGTNGPPSFNGTHSPHGINGTNGINGTHGQGMNGTNGFNGTHGHGFNGTNGTPGFNGTNGHHGKNGTNGTHTLCIKQSTPTCAQNDTATGSTCDPLTSKWNITRKHFYRLNDDVNPSCNNLVLGQLVRFLFLFFASLWSEIFVLLVCLFTDSSLRSVLRCDRWVSSW
jgi:hypothetical protein